MINSSITSRGLWQPGLAYLRVGVGNQLLFLPGITASHRPPSGLDVSFQIRQLEPFARRREVVWVNRRNGLEPPVTMAALADDYATVIRAHLDSPVDVIGVSTGGSVALQLALDHPGLVGKLVLTSAAYRLSDRGRQVQHELASHVRNGRPRRAAAAEFAAMAASPLGAGVLRAFGWAMGRRMYGNAGSDLLAVIDAEDVFDVGDRLGEVAVPTLVIGAERDRFYTPQLFRDTAARIPGGRLLLYPRIGHLLATAQRRYAVDVLEFLDGVT